MAYDDMFPAGFFLIALGVAAFSFLVFYFAGRIWLLTPDDPLHIRIGRDKRKK
jgi:hypothetical protein